VVTSGGGTCGVDLGLHLVQRLAGTELAYLTACTLEHEPSGIVVTRAAR
jgi:transcriptional regulator GlxA family with amidase domain